MTILEAFADSLNVPAVKVCNAVGPAAVVDTARRLGISGPMRAALALPLGEGRGMPSLWTSAARVLRLSAPAPLFTPAVTSNLAGTLDSLGVHRHRADPDPLQLPPSV